ncbi:hypothetical protein OK016_14220 [Vibrio chagasii]|nr:hypothetical protein [Vibrio chagasii]
MRKMSWLTTTALRNRQLNLKAKPSAVNESTQASQAAAVMNEGNVLLGQLDEANKTLNQTPNGKARYNSSEARTGSGRPSSR